MLIGQIILKTGHASKLLGFSKAFHFPTMSASVKNDPTSTFIWKGVRAFLYFKWSYVYSIFVTLTLSLCCWVPVVYPVSMMDSGPSGIRLLYVPSFSTVAAYWAYLGPHDPELSLSKAVSSMWLSKTKTKITPVWVFCASCTTLNRVNLKFSVDKSRKSYDTNLICVRF